MAMKRILILILTRLVYRKECISHFPNPEAPDNTFTYASLGYLHTGEWVLLVPWVVTSHIFTQNWLLGSANGYSAIRASPFEFLSDWRGYSDRERLQCSTELRKHSAPPVLLGSSGRNSYAEIYCDAALIFKTKKKHATTSINMQNEWGIADS